MSKSYEEDLDEDLLQFLSGELNFPPPTVLPQSESQTELTDPTPPIVQSQLDSGRLSHVSSQHSGVINLPPPTVLPFMGGPHVDSQQSGAMDLPPPTVSPHMGESHVGSQQSGGMDLPHMSICSSRV